MQIRSFDVVSRPSIRCQTCSLRISTLTGLIRLIIKKPKINQVTQISKVDRKALLLLISLLIYAIFIHSSGSSPPKRAQIMLNQVNTIRLVSR